MPADVSVTTQQMILRHGMRIRMIGFSRAACPAATGNALLGARRDDLLPIDHATSDEIMLFKSFRHFLQLAAPRHTSASRKAASRKMDETMREVAWQHHSRLQLHHDQTTSQGCTCQRACLAPSPQGDQTSCCFSQTHSLAQMLRHVTGSPPKHTVLAATNMINMPTR